MKEMYPFYLEITYGYDDGKGFVEKQEAVIIPAKNFAHAVARIEENYNEELISIEKVDCLNCGDDIVIPIAVGRAFVNAMHKYNDPAPKNEVLSVEVLNDESTYA